MQESNKLKYDYALLLKVETKGHVSKVGKVIIIDTFKEFDNDLLKICRVITERPAIIGKVITCETDNVKIDFFLVKEGEKYYLVHIRVF